MGRKRKQPPDGGTRAYCAANRQPPFREHVFAPGEPSWRKVGGGLIAVTDGTARQYVGPGLIFAVERGPDGEPQVASYGRAGQEGLAAMIPYTYDTLRTLIHRGEITRQRWVTYKEMVAMVRRLLPMAWVPTREELWAEYGLIEF